MVMKRAFQKIKAVTEHCSQRTACALAVAKVDYGDDVSKGLVVLALAGVAIASQNALAITAPAAGSFGYDIYDVGVNDILKGAPGFIGALLGIVYCASLLTKNWILAVMGILACTAVIKADAITTSLGLMI